MPVLRLLVVLACTGSLAFAADDAWAKVQKLQSGQELRIFLKGSTRSLEAQFAELTDESVVVVEKDTQKAITRDTIERIDARPPATKQKPRIKSDMKVEERPLGTGLTPTERNTSRPSQSTSSGFSLESGGKPPFENVYRRIAGKPAP